MAVEFVNAGDAVNFGTAPSTNNTQKSICAWINADSIGVNGSVSSVISRIDDVSQKGWVLAISSVGARNLSVTYTEWFDDVSYGEWYTGASISFGTNQYICATYDNSDTGNNPIIYVSSTPEALTEASTPTGGATSDTDENLVIGNRNYPGAIYDVAFDGKIQDVRTYNRILSATEVGILANSRCQKVVLGGLVFWCPCIGAAGKQSFDGASLGTTNKLIDVISGAMGTPYGNPIGRGMTIQTIGGNH